MNDIEVEDAVSQGKVPMLTGKPKSHECEEKV
jgi:hypothetical protein